MHITGKVMTSAKLVKEIDAEKYPGYDIRKINGIETPVSKPDGNKKNNIG